jgi:hypothetical protein
MTAPEDPAEGGFLRGWSRRKLAASKADVPEPDSAAPAEEPVAEPGPEPAAEPEGVDAAYIEALPPVESIGEGSDIKPFLARGVPAHLKNAALRRLWSATPGVRDYLDPAVDYAWDWNAPGGVPGGGGVLSGVRVAKMLENLIGAPKAPPDTEPPQTPDAPQSAVADSAQDASDAAPAAEVAQPPASSVRRTDSTDGTGARKAGADAPAPPAVAASAPAALPPPRRHGGAIPG